MVGERGEDHEGSNVTLNRSVSETFLMTRRPVKTPVKFNVFTIFYCSLPLCDSISVP